MSTNLGNELAKPRTPGDSITQLLAIMMFSGLSNASLLVGPAIASQLMTQIQFTPERVGYFFSVEFGGYVVAGLAGLWLLPRFNWRAIALIALLGVVAGNGASMIALYNFPALLGIRLATASCSALLSMIAMATASACEHPSRALSLAILGQLAAGVIGLAGLPFLFDQFGVNAYFSGMIVLLVVMSPFILTLAARKTGGQTSADAHAIDIGRAGLLRYPALFLFYMALAGLWTFAGGLASACNLDPIAADHILSLATFAGVVGAGAAAGVGRGVDAKLPIITGFSLLVVGSAILLAVGSRALFIGGIIAIKFAWSFAIPFALAVISRLDRNGRLFSEMTLIVGIALAAGPLLAGHLIQSSGNYTGMLLMQTSLLMGSTVSICVLTYLITAARRA